MFDVQTSVTISKERIETLIISAVELGAISYWGRFDGFDNPNDAPMGRPLYIDCPFKDEEFALLVTELEDDGSTIDRHRLDRKAIQRGLDLMAKNYPRHFTDLMEENDDTETADVFIQLALLGEIVYG